MVGSFAEVAPALNSFRYNDVTKEAIASVAGSFACVYSGQPLDTIKVRMQARPEAFSGAVQCLRTTLSQEGLCSLWKGATPALSGAVVENCVAFALNKQMKILWPPTDRHPILQPILYGGVTGALAAVTLCPFEVVKCKTQVLRSSKSSTFSPALSARDVAKQILRTDGLPGFYRGLSAQVGRDALFFGLFFGVYEITLGDFKQRARRWNVPEELAYICSGGLAGVAGWVFSMPLDTMKSVIQCQASSMKAPSVTQVASQLVSSRGLPALFSGLSVAVIRAFPSNASLFLGYEMARKHL